MSLATLVTLLTLIVFGLVVIISLDQLYMIIPIALLLVIISSYLLGNVLKYNRNSQWTSEDLDLRKIMIKQRG